METANGDRPVRHPQKKFFHRKKFCRFCTDSNIKIDYKYPAILNSFVTERGKIMPRRNFTINKAPGLFPVTKKAD